MQSKAEDEGILAYVEDDNAAMRLPGRRTCLDICLVCYNIIPIFKGLIMPIPIRSAIIEMFKSVVIGFKAFIWMIRNWRDSK